MSANQEYNVEEVELQETSASEQEVDYGEVFDLMIYHEDILRQVTQPITNFGPHLREFGEKMLRTMYKNNGVGLAANQINCKERIITVDVSREANDPRILINPEIISHSETVAIGEEGCLSVPNIYGPVERWTEIVCRYQDPEGNTHELAADGLLAVCIQHEIDHLNGVMFFDHFNSFKRNQTMNKMVKYKKVNKIKNTKEAPILASAA